eukprot:4767-Rhodomonas_salina.3
MVELHLRLLGSDMEVKAKETLRVTKEDAGASIHLPLGACSSVSRTEPADGSSGCGAWEGAIP